MKSRFTTVDIIAIIKEIQTYYVGHRAVQIYDIDNKTFLIKLSKSGEEGKTMLLIESGIRIHITEFEWAKNPSPSGFSMKLRKHIKNRRLESINQIGLDRIIDLQFGTKECAFHLIVELYDRGNMILTDHEYMILHLVRPRVDNNQDLKFCARERYHIESVKYIDYISTRNETLVSIKESIASSKPSDNIRKIISSIFAFGPNLLEHCAFKYGYSLNMKLSQCLKTDDESQIIEKLYNILVDGQNFINDLKSSEISGFIYGKSKDDNNEVTIYEEFHPFEFSQLKNKSYKKMTTFNQAVDEFFSLIESQKAEMQINQKEKSALKKLENIKLDHERRIKDLKEAQENDTVKGEMIQINSDVVNKAVLILNHMLANQVCWENVKEMVEKGKEVGDPIACLIENINFESNQITMKLENPYNEDDEDEFVSCVIDLSMNAFSNARKYFSMKKAACTKEHKTINASAKALKSAEVRTKQLLNEVQTVAKINKLRKTNWFEKFNWFISSENYLVVGGKDQQQNEHLVKRYFRPGDVYVHADIHGASSVIIKNHEYPSNRDIPPKTLTEAGHMAVIYSSAWDSKISTSAWWVYHDQVSKTAPSGEYLTTGSFMIRGKKNYLLSSIIMFGFGIMFKVADDSIINHINDRKVRESEQDSNFIENTAVEEFTEMCDEEDSSDTESDSNKADAFPDTKINLSETLIQTPEIAEIIEDIVPLTSHHKYISAKQRRDLKKQNEKNSLPSDASKEIDDTECNENTEDLKLVDDNDEKIEKPVQNGLSKVVNDALSGPLKRRQRNKLKRIQAKYKDQDDEEREMKMKILQGKNPYEENEVLKPLTKKQQRKQIEEQKKKIAEKKINQKNLERQKSAKTEIRNNPAMKTNEKDEFDDDVIVEDLVLDNSHQIINSLIGNPLPEDELLYAIPVLAPYQTLQNYKFKIKMIPGSTKRGKAGKSILFNFMVDKMITSREKDLLKALKEQDITRNFPGKVKIYTPNVTKSTKKNGLKN